MSQIFDALHQSAAERTGDDLPNLRAAKELLQVVERNAGLSAPLVEARQPAAPQRVQPFPLVKAVPPAHSKLVCFTDPESLAAETFGFLATRLRHIQQKRSLKCLVVTSCVSGEGKTMVAANLACALAAGRQRVLLVEGDLRRPSLANQLGLRGLSGLCQMLRGEDDRLDNIYSLPNSDVSILVAGDVHSSPLELMEPGRLSALIDRISDGFQWVVIDTPPVLPLADTSIWIRLADSILLVTRPGVTAKRQLQRAMEGIEQSKLIGCVLNASTEPSHNSYYYRYSARASGLRVSSSAPK